MLTVGESGWRGIGEFSALFFPVFERESKQA